MGVLRDDAQVESGTMGTAQGPLMLMGWVGLGWVGGQRLRHERSKQFRFHLGDSWR